MAPRHGSLSLCYMLSCRGLCIGPITRPERSNRMWCVCGREALIKRRPWPTGGLSHTKLLYEVRITNRESPHCIRFSCLLMPPPFLGPQTFPLTLEQKNILNTFALRRAPVLLRAEKKQSINLKYYLLLLLYYTSYI